MDLEWIILIGIFLAASGVTFAAYGVFVKRKNSAYQQRLAALEGDDNPFSTGEEKLILGDLTVALAGQSPLTKDKRKAIEQELREAGFYRPTALMEYSAIRALFILMPLFICGGIAMLLDGAAMMNVGLAGIALAVVGYSAPRLWLGYLARQRSRQIERGLPVAVDLLGLGLTGGQNIISSLARVAKEMKASNTALAEELLIVREQTEIGNLELAMMQFANRTNIPEVRTLALVLSQSERLGSDIASTLLEFSTNYRNTIRQRAESQANKANFWMLFPTVLCLWIPSLVIMLGPLYHEFTKHMSAGNEAARKTFDAHNQYIKGVGRGGGKLDGKGMQP